MEEKLRKVLKNKEYVEFAYLFGSQATGDTNSESDVDVAVYVDEKRKEDFFDIRLELIEDITRATKKEADVTILNTAKPFLAFVVIQEGKLLVNKNSEAKIESFEKKIKEHAF